MPGPVGMPRECCGNGSEPVLRERFQTLPRGLREGSRLRRPSPWVRGVSVAHKGVRGVPLLGKEVSELRKGECGDWERWDEEVPLSINWSPGVPCVRGKGGHGVRRSRDGRKKGLGVPQCGRTGELGAGGGRNEGPEGPGVKEKGGSWSWEAWAGARKGAQEVPDVEERGGFGCEKGRNGGARVKEKGAWESWAEGEKRLQGRVPGAEERRGVGAGKGRN